MFLGGVCALGGDAKAMGSAAVPACFRKVECRRGNGRAGEAHVEHKPASIQIFDAWSK